MPHARPGRSAVPRAKLKHPSGANRAEPPSGLGQNPSPISVLLGERFETPQLFGFAASIAYPLESRNGHALLRSWCHSFFRLRGPQPRLPVRPLFEAYRRKTVAAMTPRRSVPIVDL